MKKGAYKGVCSNPHCTRELTIRLVAWVLDKAKGFMDGKRKDLTNIRKGVS